MAKEQETAQATDAGKGAKHARSSRYVPAIDGLRAFAVLAVIFYHMGLDWAPGGLMGVTVFFVISGYLINGLLVAEHERTGRISLSQFWLRRVRRIIPAVLLAIAGTIVLCAIISPALLEKMRPDIVPSLLFYNNWWQIARDVSYFEAAGAPSPLTHYWSLAIEEQFYIVWPLLLTFLLNRKLGKRTIVVIVLVLAAASATEMALLYDPHGDPSRVYYGTDTRAMSLLLGVALALVWPSAAFGSRGEHEHLSVLANGRVRIREIAEEQFEPRTLSKGAQLVLNIAGVLAFAGLVAIVGFTNGFSDFPYLGGIALTSALSALLIAAAVMPRSWIGRILSLKPLAWIGKRSYGMYLWHFPILLLTSKINLPIDTPWWVHFAQIVIIFAISDLSYRFVEDPIRKRAIGKWLRKVDKSKRRNANESKKPRVRSVVTVIAVAALFAGAVASLALVEAPESEQEVGAVQAIALRARPHVQRALAQKREAERKQAAKNAYEKKFHTPRTNKNGDPIFEPLLIGDSIPQGAYDEFYAAFPNGYVDAVRGRYIWENPYEEYLEKKQVGTYVVFCLGTNNAVDDQALDELLSKVSDKKKVILVNTRAPYFDWDKSTNEAMERARKRHSNIVAVVDWYGASANHPEYFVEDGAHLKPEGAQVYIALIEKAIRESMGAE